ncbi:tripartite tricarboxylate transporter substrate binding protein [Variovorax sp. OV084]|jgi:tripartite-type tricarboxylate transporter receptor subunit TctC|uniref:Bug family tripartite tricarboxylate transporter substrate binding protein n=1 Tax=Variovorax sp. OV084 TaxID=1882777 RepID=UPI0008C44DCD|nr:Tripartite-type tricarboxylate transporter, receptor component TctC [Variovorax sp. OV084]
MRHSRRGFVGLMLTLAAGLRASPALAAPLSSRPIRLVVPFGAGGVADLVARSVAQKMSESMGQSIVVDNKPGAGGVVASDTVAKAPPDGHTLLLMSNGNAVSVGLFKSLPYDTVKDFTPISTLGYFDMAVLAASNSKFKTFTDLVAHAKAHPGQLNIGTINVGSTQNLAGELLKSSLGIDAQVVPFNGTPAVVTALRGGQVDVAVEILSPVLSQIEGKAMRALAVMGDKRSPSLPDVPTVAESGTPGFQVASWNALAAPAKTPPDVIARLNQEARAALASPEVKKRLQSLGVEPRGSTPQEQARLLDSEIQRWSAVIQRAGIPKQ